MWYSWRSDCFISTELGHQFVAVELLPVVVDDERIADPLQAAIDLLDRSLGTCLLQLGHRGGLGAMEKDERPVLFVGKRSTAGSGECCAEKSIKASVWSASRTARRELPQRQPADPAVIELEEFAIHLHALLLGQRERLGFAQGLLDQRVEQRIGTLGPGAVGTTGRFHLQHAHLDPHLHDLTSVLCTDQPCTEHARLVRPILQDPVDVAAFGHWSLPCEPANPLPTNSL